MLPGVSRTLRNGTEGPVRAGAGLPVEQRGVKGVRIGVSNAAGSKRI